MLGKRAAEKRLGRFRGNTSIILGKENSEERGSERLGAYMPHIYNFFIFQSFIFNLPVIFRFCNADGNFKPKILG